MIQSEWNNVTRCLIADRIEEMLEKRLFDGCAAAVLEAKGPKDLKRFYRGMYRAIRRMKAKDSVRASQGVADGIMVKGDVAGEELSGADRGMIDSVRKLVKYESIAEEKVEFHRRNGLNGGG